MRKKFVGLNPMPDKARSRRMSGTQPKMKVGPGCAFQEVGRIHHTSKESIIAVVAIADSIVVRERSYAGVR